MTRMKTESVPWTRLAARVLIDRSEGTPPRPRPAAVVIADLLRARVTPTRSREEQAFIELQRGWAT